MPIKHISDTDSDPRHKGPKPPFHEHAQKMPGHERKMNIKPDHGEGTYIGNGRLKGKTALVSSADSGIGRAVALAYAREGADVAISYLNKKEYAEDSAKAAETPAKKLYCYPAIFATRSIVGTWYGLPFKRLAGSISW